MINDIINILLPETILAFFIMLQLLLSLLSNTKHYRSAKWISISGIILAIYACSEVQVEPQYFAFKDTIMSDPYTLLFKFLILISGFFVILLTKKEIDKKRDKAYSFHAILLTAILSAMSLPSCNDFLTLFIVYEVLSISSFFIISFQDGYRTKQSALKYIITNMVSTSIYLLGVSYMYGLTQSLNFNTIFEYYTAHTPNLLYALSSILIITGLLFKLAIFPFANWIIDIYKNTGLAINAFLSIIPNIAVIGIICRLLVFPLSYSFELVIILLTLSLITALWANCFAIKETNIKSIMACSSSANFSYMLCIATLVSVYNISTVIFYLTTYIFMTLGVFAGIIVIENSDFTNKISELKNYAYIHPCYATQMCICLFGLIGLPLTSGFIAKLYLISGIIRSGIVFLPFLAILIIAMVIACFYYLKIIKQMFIKNENSPVKIVKFRVSTAISTLYLCSIITLLIGLFPSKIIELCLTISYNM